MGFAYHGPHPVFTQPNVDERLWRYVSLAKFVAMLDRGALHFARADQLNDPFEGSWTRNHAAMVLVDHEGKAVSPQPSEEEKARWRAHETPEWRAASWKNRRESTAVNCWYVGECESAAMWLLYAAEGIAIETSFGSFLGSLPKAIPGEGSQRIEVGMVHYVDYETAVMPPGNGFWPFIHKRRSFAHEQEFRAVIYEIGPNMINHGSFSMRDAGVPPDGFSVPVDLQQLIRAVHVAPSSPAWFADSVKAVVRTFGHKFPVLQSQLDVNPFH
jgi:hypothetical protein